MSGRGQGAGHLTTGVGAETEGGAGAGTEGGAGAEREKGVGIGEVGVGIEDQRRQKEAKADPEISSGKRAEGVDQETGEAGS